ncbi:hypothetical protein J6590_094464 [Homalodisca vitripennis]|nr:hypothetical protein J6590_094464 [Homalodisca vitripennis]
MVIPHLPYSPDLAPSEYHLFPAVKTWLATQRFDDEVERREGLKGDFRNTTNGRVGGLLGNTGSLSGHPPKQQQRLALLDPVILR